PGLKCLAAAGDEVLDKVHVETRAHWNEEVAPSTHWHACHGRHPELELLLQNVMEAGKVAAGRWELHEGNLPPGLADGQELSIGGIEVGGGFGVDEVGDQPVLEEPGRLIEQGPAFLQPL